MRVVAKYTNAFSANLAKGMLESEGIQAEVLNQNISFVAAANTDMLSIDLVVNDEDYSKASKLLAASSSAE